jgi:hypothetical protein
MFQFQYHYNLHTHVNIEHFFPMDILFCIKINFEILFLQFRSNKRHLKMK